MMYQIVKLVGVSPEALERIHELLRSDMIKTTKVVARRRINNLLFNERLICVELLKSQWNKSEKGYCVELRVEMAIDCFENAEPEPNKARVKAMFFPDLLLMKAIYNALGVYPEEEILVPISEA